MTTSTINKRCRSFTPCVSAFLKMPFKCVLHEKYDSICMQDLIYAISQLWQSLFRSGVSLFSTSSALSTRPFNISALFSWKQSRRAKTVRAHRSIVRSQFALLVQPFCPFHPSASGRLHYGLIKRKNQVAERISSSMPLRQTWGIFADEEDESAVKTEILLSVQKWRSLVKI